MPSVLVVLHNPEYVMGLPRLYCTPPRSQRMGKKCIVVKPRACVRDVTEQIQRVVGLLVVSIGKGAKK